MSREKKEPKPVPEVGKLYHFWDDGKTGPSRHYLCKVEELVTVKQAKEIILEENCIEDYPLSLYDIWKYQIDQHRQGENVKHIGNGGSTETGAPWLYAEDTDYFVKISCPKYDKDPIWAVRTVWGGWFTMDTTNWWQGGTLDVTGEIYADVINDWELNNGDISVYEDVTYE